jgi:hypothetical protein
VGKAHLISRNLLLLISPERRLHERKQAAVAFGVMRLCDEETPHVARHLTDRHNRSSASHSTPNAAVVCRSVEPIFQVRIPKSKPYPVQVPFPLRFSNFMIWWEEASQTRFAMIPRLVLPVLSSTLFQHLFTALGCPVYCFFTIHHFFETVRILFISGFDNRHGANRCTGQLDVFQWVNDPPYS